MVISPLLEGAIVGGAGSVIAGIVLYLFKRQIDRRDKIITDQAADKAKLAGEARGRDEKITALQVTVEHINEMVLPFWAATQKKLAEDLTHYHTLRLDHLLTLMGPPWLGTPEEEAEFYKLLSERTVTLNGQIGPDEKDSAEMLPAVMRKAVREMKDMVDPKTPDAVLQVVSTKPPVEK